MQAPGAVLQGRSLPAGFWPRYRAALPQLLLIGLSLGTHFGAWGWSVAHTSLAHSLLLVWSTPLLMVALMAARAALHGRGPWAALEEPVGQTVPAAQACSGPPLEQSMPGGQGAHVSWRMRWLFTASLTYTSPRRPTAIPYGTLKKAAVPKPF
jgi:hypothetical protein